MALKTRPGDAAGIQSADRALSILETIGLSPVGVSAAEIASEHALSVATVYRLLATLQRHGYVVKQSEGHRYVLGRTVDSLGRAVQLQLLATPEVRGVLQAVHDGARAPAYLTVFRGDDIAVAHIAESPSHPRITQLHVGFAEASHVTAFGKLMLAAKDDEALNRFFESNSPRALTTRSVTDVAKLREQLDDVRAQQIAIEVEEYMPKLACIAAPVRSRSGRTIGAVSVSVTADEFSRRAHELEKAVRRGAWQVASQLER